MNLKTVSVFVGILITTAGFEWQKAQQSQVVVINGKHITLTLITPKNTTTYLAKSSINSLTPLTIQKINGIIKLKVFNGKYVTLKDIKGRTSDDTKKVTHKIIGMLLDRFYVVMVTYYETGEYLLIDKNNGIKHVLWNAPILSPDKTYIATYSGSLDYDMMPNGIQLFKITPKKILLEWEYKPTDWEPNAVVWLSKNKLLVNKIIPDYLLSTKRSIKSYIEVKF